MNNWTIDKVHNQILFLLNKDQTGYVTHDEIDIALDLEQMKMFEELVQSPKTHKFHDYLMPFKTTKEFNDQNYHPNSNTFGTGPDGVLVLPTDYQHLLALYRYAGTFGDHSTLSMSTTGSGSVSSTLQAGKIYKITITFTGGSSTAFRLRYGDQTVVNTQDISGTFVAYFMPNLSNQNILYNTSATGTLDIDLFTKTVGSEYMFEVVSEDELGSRLGSALVAPSTDDPIAILAGAGGVVNGQDISTQRKIQLFPEQGHYGRLVYLRRPASPVFAYTQSGRTITYNSGSSTQLEWDDTAIEKLIQRTVTSLALNIQDSTAYQHGELRKSQE